MRFFSHQLLLFRIIPHPMSDRETFANYIFRRTTLGTSLLLFNVIPILSKLFVSLFFPPKSCILSTSPLIIIISVLHKHIFLFFNITDRI